MRESYTDEAANKKWAELYDGIEKILMKADINDFSPLSKMEFIKYYDCATVLILEESKLFNNHILYEKLEKIINDWVYNVRF